MHKLPSHKQSLGFLKEAGMPQNILEHSLQVNRVAVFLAEKIRANNHVVDVDLVDRASLLHDLDKHLTFNTGNHGEVGKKFLEEKGFPVLARFCMTHNLSYVLEHELPALEDKIVFYADKRVNGSQIVSTQKRLDYIREKYGSRSSEALKQILACEKPLLEIEKEILRLAKIDGSLSGL